MIMDEAGLHESYLWVKPVSKSSRIFQKLDEKLKDQSIMAGVLNKALNHLPASFFFFEQIIIVGNLNSCVPGSVNPQGLAFSLLMLVVK